MEIDIGIVGAKRTSFSEHNLRDLLRHVQEANPEATEELLRDLLREEVLRPGNTGYVLTCIDYAVANVIKCAMKPRRAPARTHLDDGAPAPIAAANARRDAVKSVIGERIVEQAKVLLMDMTMPNGLPLSECVGPDCRAAGGWLVRVADLIGDAKVGDVLDEARLRSIYAS